MQGLLAKARQKGAEALDHVAQSAHAHGIPVAEGHAVGSGSGVYTACGVGDATLQAALRSVTHTNTATVSREALREVERLADVNEDALAAVLKHIEENAREPPKEWRKIHGALKLLEQFLQGSEKDSSLIGRVWFEVKMLPHLNEFENFSYEADERVQLLIRRTAASVRHAAEHTILLDLDSPSSLPTEGGAAATSRREAERREADSSSEHPPQRSDEDAGTKAFRPERKQHRSDNEAFAQHTASKDAPSLNDQPIGRPLADHGPSDIEEALRASRAESRGESDSSYQSGDAERALQFVAGQRRAAARGQIPSGQSGSTDSPRSPVPSLAISGGALAAPPPRRFCCRCLWQRRKASSSGSRGPTVVHPSEVAQLIK